MRQSMAALLLIASLAACARENNAAPGALASNAAQSTAAPATAADPAAAASPEAAKGVGDLAAAAATQQEGSDLGATADSGESQLERIAALPSEGELPDGKWVPGKNYKVVSPAQPTNVAPGKVEVIEMFWYGCPHCYALDPAIESWRKNKPVHIEFVRVPVMWDQVHRAHARLFYTLKALGKLDELHTKVFDDIHENHNFLFVPNDPLADATRAIAIRQGKRHQRSEFHAGLQLDRGADLYAGSRRPRQTLRHRCRADVRNRG